jgi:hypothetical protein
MHDGKPLAGKIRSAWEGIIEDAGLGEDVVRHSLRHTAATWLMQKGTDRWQAAGWLGMTSSNSRTARAIIIRTSRAKPPRRSAGDAKSRVTSIRRFFCQHHRHKPFAIVARGLPHKNELNDQHSEVKPRGSHRLQLYKCGASKSEGRKGSEYPIVSHQQKITLHMLYRRPLLDGFVKAIPQLILVTGSSGAYCTHLLQPRHINSRIIRGYFRKNSMPQGARASLHRPSKLAAFMNSVLMPASEISSHRISTQKATTGHREPKLPAVLILSDFAN